MNRMLRKPPAAGRARFRQLYVKLNNAAGKGDLESAKTAGERAIVIAAENNWPYLVTAAQMALAAAYLGAGQIADTIACYQAANAAVAGSEDPAEQKLDVQTRMAEGSAHIADEQYGTAADVLQTRLRLQRKRTTPHRIWNVRGWPDIASKWTGRRKKHGNGASRLWTSERP